MASKERQSRDNRKMRESLKDCLMDLRFLGFRTVDAEVYWQINDALLRGLEVLRQQEKKP